MSFDPTEQVSELLASIQPPSRPVDRAWRRVNPKWLLVARIFVTLIAGEQVLSRLTVARSLADLKALLCVDQHLGRIRDAAVRRRVCELLASPTTPLAVVEGYAALSFARELAWNDEDGGLADRVCSVQQAAMQLGVRPETLYQAILDEQVAAELMISSREVERLHRHRPSAWE